MRIILILLEVALVSVGVLLLLVTFNRWWTRRSADRLRAVQAANTARAQDLAARTCPTHGVIDALDILFQSPDETTWCPHCFAERQRAQGHPPTDTPAV